MVAIINSQFDQCLRGHLPHPSSESNYYHETNHKSGCATTDGPFIRHNFCSDDITLALAFSASDTLRIPADGVLEVLRQNFMKLAR